MPRVFRPSFISLLLLLFTFGAESIYAASWEYLDLPVDRELSAVSQLEANGITTLAWSNALVEVSAFEGLELVPLAQLDQRLTPQDPRWDPWLIGLRSAFRPQEAVSRIWIDSEKQGDARRLLSSDSIRTPSAVPGARGTTGWMLVGFSLIYLILRLWSERRTRPARLRRRPRPWTWLALVLVLLSCGIVLVAAKGRDPTVTKVSLGSWPQHLWFQEAWPFGAAWTDWTPGKAWGYPSYERREGKLVEVVSLLPKSDKAWLRAAVADLDVHNPARIFAPANP